jgi:hypothetical protein
MSTPIQAKQRVRAQKLLNTASDALYALVNERLNLGSETKEAINAARSQIQIADAELHAQPGA